jgi:hypothetical protein
MELVGVEDVNCYISHEDIGSPHKSAHGFDAYNP